MTHIELDADQPSSEHWQWRRVVRAGEVPSSARERETKRAALFRTATSPYCAFMSYAVLPTYRPG